MTDQSEMFDGVLDQLALLASITAGFLVSSAWNRLFHEMFDVNTKDDDPHTKIKKMLFFACGITLTVMAIAAGWLWLESRSSKSKVKLFGV